MHRTNLAIKREIMKFCRNTKISLRVLGGGIFVDNCPVSVNDGYVYAYIRSGTGQFFCYQVEYLTTANWYKKFDRMRSATAVVFSRKSQNIAYANNKHPQYICIEKSKFK